MKRNKYDPIPLVTLQTSTFYTRILFIIKKIKYFDNEIFNKLINQIFFLTSTKTAYNPHVHMIL